MQNTDVRAKASVSRVYVSNADNSVRVPMREILLTNGETHRLYDTSGPYGDPDVTTDVRAGLEPLREIMGS